MRTSISLVAALVLANVVLAQNPTPEGYELTPGRATSANPNTAGYFSIVRAVGAGGSFPAWEALMQYDEKYVQGLGDLRNSTRGLNKTSVCEINTFNIRYEDANGRTSEPFSIIARPETAKGSRIADRTKTIWTQTVPGFPAQGGAGAIGILTTVQVMTSATPPAPAAVPVPCRDTFFFGMGIPALPPNTTWPTGPTADGLSVLTVDYVRAAGANSGGDWPKGGNSAPVLYYVIVTGGGAGHFAQGTTVQKMLFGYSLIPDTPVLQVGANHKKQTAPHGADHGYGAAGIWPEIIPTTARGKLSTDGTVIRITDNNVRTAPGTWTLFASLTSSSRLNLPIFGVPGISGGIYLGIPSFFITAGATGGVDTEVVIAPPGTLPTNLVGATVYFQAVVAAPQKQPAITNMAAVEFK